MSKHVKHHKRPNADELLCRLPNSTRTAFEEAVRRAATRQDLSVRPNDSDVPAFVRELAVGEWRARYMEGASKTARRKNGYERLKNDPSFVEIQDRIMREHGLAPQRLRAKRDARNNATSFSDACASCKRAYPRYGHSPVDSILQSTIKSSCEAAVNMATLKDEITSRLLLAAKTSSLDRLGHHRHAFDLQGVTCEEEALQRVLSTRLVPHLIRREFGRRAKGPLVKNILEARFQANPDVRAVCALARTLYEDDPAEKLVARNAQRLARKLDEYVQGKQFAHEVAVAAMANPHFESQVKYAVELRNRVRENVPQTPMEAYPLARTMHRSFVLHVGPTNSGKTHDALEALMAAPSGAYLGPLRLLAYEQFETMNHEGCPCSLLTGEEATDVPGATHVSSTIEMADYYTPIDVAVVDEAQMIADNDRGHRWTAAILGIPATEVHVCCAPHAQHVIEQLVRLCGDDVQVVRHERLVPLAADRGSYRLPQSVQPGDALIVFSRRSVHAVATEVSRQGLKPSMVYGALPHDVRHEEARRFDAGETDVVVATDAIGMGMNLPIRRVVFVEQEKFDGRTTRTLRPEEVQQIAGRAGRFGRYDKGLYHSTRLRKDIVQRYRKPVPVISSIPVGIPANIALVRDATLSDSVRQWMEIEQPAPFTRISVIRDLRLICDVEKRITGDLRTNTNTKLLVLSLASMPFDERDDRLFAAWHRMVDAELAGQELTLAPPDAPRPNVELAQLEADYRYCDLLYTYARTFGHDSQLAPLVTRRNQISHTIMDLLARPQAEES